MIKKVIYILCLPFFGTVVGLSQELVTDGQRSTYEYKSYYYVQQLSLKPGFSVSGTQGEFFVKPMNSAATTGQKNSMRTETILRSGVTNESDIAALDDQSKSVIYEYQDGLGRNLQTTLVRQSPASNDIHQIFYYDGNGRESRGYLPYTAVTNGGAYNGNGFNEQNSFYSNGSDLIANDSRPYWERAFENSPLGRLRDSQGLGNAWVGKKMINGLKVNDANTVRLWTISSGLPRSTAYYPAGTLSIKEKTDEEGKALREYIDTFGNIVLTQRQANGGTWLSTYVVYNDFGKPLFIIPPAASTTLTPDINFVNKWCFQFEYDEYQRVTGSKMPGAGWVYTIYDQWDRAVLVQNANQRAKSPAEWTFIKYDELNRPVITGTYTSTSTRAILTSNVAASTGRFETRNTSSPGYSLTQSFPTTATESMLLSIAYFDNYDYLTNTGWDAEGFDYRFTTEAGYTGTAFNTVKGFQTGSKTRVVNSAQWLNSVTYYDNKYRALQTITEHHLAGTVRVTTEYESFRGLVKSVLQVQTNPVNTRIEQRFTYDTQGRQLLAFHKIDSQPEVLMSSMTYNEIGQVVTKKLHSDDNGATVLQAVDYRYTIQGWLSSVNYSSSGSADPTDYYGYALGYADALGSGNLSRYDGLVSGSKWKQDISGSEKAYNYSYDNTGRLTSGAFKHNPGTGWLDSGHYSETITSGYNENGNINSLSRATKNGINSAEIDQLSYTYDGNQLQTVVDAATDASLKDLGFKDGSGGGADYMYNVNGDLISDVNRGITEIAYNVLNLIDKVTFSDGSSMQYVYDASGTKLSQSYFLEGSSTPQVKTDYVGEKVYIDGSLAIIKTSEGRILPPSYTNLIKNKDAGSTEGFTNVGASMSVVVQNSETYVRAICNQVGGSAGIYPIGGNIAVRAGEKYSFKVLGYRSTSGSAYLYVKASNGADIVAQGPLMPQGLANETWSSTEFIVPTGVTSINVGVRWSSPTTNETFFINRVALYKLDWEYQYLLTDHVGSPRVVLSTNPSTLNYTATFETANQNLEASQFFNINTSKTLAHSSNITPGGTRVISMNNTYRIGPSRSLKVYPGDQVDASVNSFYAAASGLTDAAGATLASALIQVMTNQGITGFDGGINSAYTNSEGSVAGFALSPSNGSTRPSAFLNYILFDENYVSLEAKSFPVGATAGQSSLISISGNLGSAIQVKKLGYMFIYLSYDNENTNSVYFDQFNIVHTESPMVQVNDYYPYGLLSYSWLREGEYENRFTFQGKELDSKTGWHDFHARQYDATLARWLAVDPEGALRPQHSIYMAMGDNPVMNVDPDGEFFGSILVASLYLGETLFFKGGLDFTSRSARRSAWREYDPTRQGSRTNNAWKIDMGLFQTDANNNFGQRLWQLVSRFTWELPTTITGNTAAHLFNINGNINEVHYFRGITVIDSNIERGAMTLSPYIIGPPGFRADWRDHLFVHEFGHTIQSRRWGPLFMPLIAPASLQTAAFSQHHERQWYETQASKYGARFFDKHYGSGAEGYVEGSPDFFDRESFEEGGSPYTNPRNNGNNNTTHPTSGGVFNPLVYWYLAVVAILVL